MSVPPRSSVSFLTWVLPVVRVLGGVWEGQNAGALCPPWPLPGDSQRKAQRGLLRREGSAEPHAEPGRSDRATFGPKRTCKFLTESQSLNAVSYFANNCQRIWGLFWFCLFGVFCLFVGVFFVHKENNERKTEELGGQRLNCAARCSASFHLLFACFVWFGWV